MPNVTIHEGAIIATDWTLRRIFQTIKFIPVPRPKKLKQGKNIFNMNHFLYKLFRKLNSIKNIFNNNFSNFLVKDVNFNPLILSIILNSFFYILLIIFTIPGYRSNDDIILNLISSGFFGKETSEYLLFGSTILGNLFKLLYNIVPQYNWYLLFLILTQFLSHVFALYYFLKASNKYFSLFIYCCLFFIFSINLYTEINFSGTALVAMSVSFLILYTVLNKKKIIIFDYVLLFLSSSVAFLIRKDVFYIFCFIFVLYTILYLKRWKTLLTIFSVITICFLLFNMYNTYYYKSIDPEQLQYQKARVSIIDWSVKPSKTELATHGWDKEDYDLFISFKGVDNIFYSKASIINLSKNISYKFDYNKILLSPYALILYVINDFYYYSFALVFLFILFYLMRKSFRFFFFMHLFWILSFFILGIIIVHYRQYIYYTLLFYLGLSGCFYILQKTNSNSVQATVKKSISYIFLLLFSLSSISLINIIHYRIIQNHQNTRDAVFNNYDNKIVELQNSNKKFLMVGEESESLFSKWATFKSLKNNSDKRLEGKIISTGWFINTIQFDRIVNGSVIKLLIEGKIYFLGKDEELFNSLKKFIYKHYNLQVDFIELNSFEYSPVYKLITIFPK